MSTTVNYGFLVLTAGGRKSGGETVAYVFTLPGERQEKRH